MITSEGTFPVRQNVLVIGAPNATSTTIIKDQRNQSGERLLTLENIDEGSDQCSHQCDHVHPSADRVQCDPMFPALLLITVHLVLNKTHSVCLGDDPGVFQTLSSCRSFFRPQLQHGEEERAELDGFVLRPLVLIEQYLMQAPGLQL